MTGEFLEFSGFDWDAGSQAKNLSMGFMLQGANRSSSMGYLVILDDPKHSVAEDGFAAFGQTGLERMLVVVLSPMSSLIRIISAG